MTNPTLSPRKSRYKSIIFKTIRDLGKISRMELSSKLGINKNTVSSVVDELLAEGLIKVKGSVQNQNAGRNPVNLTVNEDAFYALGISVSAEKISLTVTDFCSNPVHSIQQHVSSYDMETIKNVIASMVNGALEQFNDREIIGIGLGIPGILDENRETLKYSSHLKWNNVNFVELLAEELQLGIPIKMNNNVKVAAIGEIHQFPVKKRETVFYCNIGHGVGGSIVVKGKTLSGMNNSAGELGHITIKPDGPLCNCGNRGCLETLISSPSLVHLALEKIRSVPGSPLNDLLVQSSRPIELEDLVQSANKGEPVAVEIIQQAGTYLGAALSYIVNLLNPHRIILSGPITGAYDILSKSVQNELLRKSLYTSLPDLTVEKSTLGPNAIAIGSATSVILDWLPN